MHEAYETNVFEYEGRKFEAALYADYDMEPPWEVHEGHGPVREMRGGDTKKPGERLMHNRSHSVWAYDFVGATYLAKEEGWGIGPDGEAKLAAKLGRAPTKGEIIAQAVQQDFDHLNGWLREEWFWIGVAVRILDENGKPVGDEFAHACWGFESSDEYWREVASELASEIMREVREVQYWAERDVVTQ